MESAPSSFDRIKEHPKDPNRIDYTINSMSSATFVYEPETGKVIRSGEFVNSSSLDIPPAKFIGSGPLKNAEAVAVAYFKSRAIDEVRKDVQPGSQYELDLGDQSVH